MRKVNHWVAAFSTVALFSVIAVHSEAQNASRGEPQFTPEGSQSCLVCHSGEKMQAMINGPHGEGDKPYTPMNQQGCESCHGPGSFHVSRAHGGAGFPNMLNFGHDDDAGPHDDQLKACLSCHAKEHDGGDPIVFIGSPHDDGEINCSSCHMTHVEQDPILADMTSEAESCYGCHEDMREGHNQFEGRSIDVANLACSTCHDVHAVQVD